MACCEALLGRKLQGITRCPASAHERADNIQTVIWELSHTVLQTDLSHISSKGVVAGDPVDIHNLLEILSALLSTDDQLITTGKDNVTVVLHCSKLLNPIGLQMSLQIVASCAEVREELHGDGSCANHRVSHASHNVQPNASQMHADSDAEADHKPSRGSQDALHQQYTSTAASAPSPTSVRPKPRSASTSSHHKAAEHGANHSSQCSQCMDSTAGAAATCCDAADAGANADDETDTIVSSDAASQHQEQQQQGKQAHVHVDSDAAEHVRQHQQQGRKPAGKAAGGKRKLRVKKQSRRAPLVMSKCYAAAVAPAQQDGPWQADNPDTSQEDRCAALLSCLALSQPTLHALSLTVPWLCGKDTALTCHIYHQTRTSVVCPDAASQRAQLGQDPERLDM